MVPGPEKVVKIWRKLCLTVMMDNDKNCTPKSVYVSGTNPSHLGYVFNFSCSDSIRTWKVVKTRPKHFSTVLTRNNKNCTRKIVSMFRVQNWVFWASFSTLPALVVPEPGKVVKIRPKQFSTIDWKWYQLHHKLCGYVSGAKLSHPGSVFNITCSSGTRARKSRQNSTQTVFSNTSNKW